MPITKIIPIIKINPVDKLSNAVEKNIIFIIINSNDMMEPKKNKQPIFWKNPSVPNVNTMPKKKQRNQTPAPINKVVIFISFMSL